MKTGGLFFPIISAVFALLSLTNPVVLPAQNINPLFNEIKSEGSPVAVSHKTCCPSAFRFNSGKKALHPLSLIVVNNEILPITTFSSYKRKMPLNPEFDVKRRERNMKLYWLGLISDFPLIVPESSFPLEQIKEEVCEMSGF